MKAYKPVGTILKNEVFSKKQPNAEVIIGIDPGLQNLGIGIIKIKPNSIVNARIHKKKTLFDPANIAQNIVSYSYMLIKFKPGRNLEAKLAFAFENISKLFEELEPKLLVIEDAFVGINKNSALKLGIMRGCILTIAGLHKVECETMPPAQIKMLVTGNGAAQKEDIRAIFADFLPNWSKIDYHNIPLDSSDALAAAFCGIKSLAKIEHIG